MYRKLKHLFSRYNNLEARVRALEDVVLKPKVEIHLPNWGYYVQSLRSHILRLVQ